MKTGGQVETDFYRATKKTELSRKISGEVYRDGFRPRNSKKEDIIIRMTALSVGQLQEGVLTILVFVPDSEVYGKGNLKRNITKLNKFEELGEKAVEEIRQELSEYQNVELQTGIQSYPDSNEEHFVSIKISFQILNKDY